MVIPEYPNFAPVSLEMRDELYPSLNMIKDGISEFTFSNLYLFRHTYGYRVSRIPGKTFIVDGSKLGKSFFYAPCALPEPAILDELMAGHDYLKNLSETQADAHRAALEMRGYSVVEDRDNFDYLYLRTDLAELTGQTYHKKRTLVNAFLSSYEYEQKPLRRDNLADAIAVLDEWRESKGFEGDYKASREALETFELLGMRGCVYYVAGSPAGWCLGEPLARGRMFAVHFEKAIERYKGIYQFINQAFAQALPAHYITINREQDLGDEGLRQAKMTYRPMGFVNKYRVIRTDRSMAAPSNPEIADLSNA
ncbi:MAG TPA: phosphatidylglycerol lysyltransferase domain-containing protein [Rectinemataceae bacterium]|nr:phosphatidylglycerol lysyltransferase domain-containing protein [Rectinemataceae bacterium]